MNIKLICISIIILAVCLSYSLSTSQISAQQNQSKSESPLLDANVIPGIHLYLLKFEHSYTDWSEYDEDALKYYQKKGINIQKYKAAKIEECNERWCSLPLEKVNELKSRSLLTKKSSNSPSYWWIRVERCFLKSPEGALEWARQRTIDYTFEDGSKYGMTFGDKNWVSENQETIIFTKGNVFISVTVHKTQSQESGANNVKNLAKIIESRL